ncbi:MAG: DEAD/DEAH box helicase [Treponema sp.]|nr:DEAD/DEAH box helicase [Treponema sp.]
MQNNNPLIVQSDKTLLLDVHAPHADECRDALIPFAELERSPEHLHTYRLTPLSLWNAASAGFTARDTIAVLEKYSRFDMPQSVSAWIFETAERFGKLRLIPSGNESYLYLVTDSERIYKELCANTALQKLLITGNMQTNALATHAKTCGMKNAGNAHARADTCTPQFSFLIKLTDRGTVKQELLKAGWPVKDDVPLADGEELEITLRKTTSAGVPLVVRDYQTRAALSLVGNKGAGTGFGTIVLPCGAGKTIVGMKIMELLKTSTLIVTTNITAVHQWITELLDKTNLTKNQIAEYTGEEKTIACVTVATYQILTWRPEKDGQYPHFSLFRKRPWGLIIYDEVHMLPAPIFRVVAELQAVRRVGLTATLVREDGCEGYVFSLVGPKRYDVPWKELEKSGWIATAECIEVRVDLSSKAELDYAVAAPRTKHRIASENPVKDKIVKEIVDRFPDDKILVIGHYIKQLENLAKILNAPIITGRTPVTERDNIYADFRSGNVHVLVVSKVANFAIDLPDASLAIQVSGTFGSRQEEAQRLGRILRPKERMSRFFTLISRGTVEEDFGANRQKFLAEQGYSYRIIRYRDEHDFDELPQVQEMLR